MILLNLACAFPDDLLTALGAHAVISVERSTAETGTYAEVGTVAVLAATYAYVYLDLTSPVGAWYRTRYVSADGHTASDYSAAWQGDAAVAGGVCSLQDVRRRMGKAAADHSEDDVIAGFCAMATTEVTRYTGRRFWPFTETRVFDGDESFNGGRTLFIPEGIRTVTSIKVRYVTGGAQVTVDPTYYRLQPGANQRPYGWPYTQIDMTDLSPYSFNQAAYDATEIEFDGGWAETPTDLHEAAVNAVVRATRAKGSGQADAVGNTATGQAIILRQFSPSERAMLDFYRDPAYR